MACVNGRTNPGLWASAKRRAIVKLGRFSARAMQLAARMYRDEGGRYCGKKTAPQRSMTKWTKERWQTAPGSRARACRKTKSGRVVCDRYLPAAAWKKLSPAQRAATRSKKLRARGQWVENTSAAKTAGKAARR